MAQPQWSTPERKQRLVQLAVAYKGRCLQGHALCQVVEHYVHTTSKVEVASHPVTAADVRDGRAIAFPCHGVGIVELAHAVSGGPVVGPMRVAVEHQELSDLYGVAEEQAVEDWKAEDREARAFDRQLRQQRAPTGEVGRFVQFSTGKSRRRHLDPIEMEKYVASRPKYHLLGYGLDNQMRRFAQVRVAGTSIILNVDVSQSIQELSQRRRKWLNRQGIKPQTAEAIIDTAVASWWAS